MEKNTVSDLYRRLVESLNLSPVDLIARERAGSSESDWASLKERPEVGAICSFPGDFRRAVKRLERAVLEGSKSVVYGDYDVDGITSSIIVLDCLDLLGFEGTGYFIPSRYDTGYGLNRSILEMMRDRGYTFLIAVDNGITKREECSFLSESGIDCLILDHHEEQKGSLPDLSEDCVMYHRNDCSAAFLALMVTASVLRDEGFLSRCRGTGLRVAEPERIEHHIRWYQSLAGLAVLSDCMSLRSLHNLAVLKRGLNFIREGVRESDPERLFSRFAALIDDYSPRRQITYRDLSFEIISKLNAVARVWGGNKTSIGVRFLREKDPAKISQLAGRIRRADTEKREAVRRSVQSSRPRMVGGALVLDLTGDESIPSGLTGLIANRLMDSRGEAVPTVVICRSTIDASECIGSLRGPAGSSLNRVLDREELSPYLVAHGGHEAACGFTARMDGKEELIGKLGKLLENVQRSPVPSVRIDEEDVSESGFRAISLLEPFGTDFELPRLKLDIHNGRLKRGIRGDHCFVDLSGGGRAVLFGQAGAVSSLPSNGFSTIVGELVSDTFRGIVRYEFKGELETGRDGDADPVGGRG